MEKRPIATIHELLSLTVEKKISLERIAHFRQVMNLSKKLKDFHLQHQGIFYISTRGNYGKLHTVFLREAYKKGELIEPNDLYLARRKLAELVLLSPRKVTMDRELVSCRRDREDDGTVSIQSDYVENGFEGFVYDEDIRQDSDRGCDSYLKLDSDADSDYSDEGNECEETVDAET